MGFTQMNQNVKRAKKRCKQEPTPKTKLYVILCDNQTMIVPIKADRSPYPRHNNLLWFAGGAPQFFGGSPEGSSTPLETMQREVEQESRSTLALLDFHNAPILSAPPSETDINTYMFYYSLKWRRTETPWDPNVTAPSQREMQRVVEVPRNIFRDQTDFNVIIGILEHETNTVNALGFNQFHESHTARAFSMFIRDIWFQV